MITTILLHIIMKENTVFGNFDIDIFTIDILRDKHLKFKSVKDQVVVVNFSGYL